MKAHLYILILFLCISIFDGCKKNSIEPNDSIPNINGKIVDSNNNPIPDVDIHYIWYWKSNPISDYIGSINLQYSVPTDQKVTTRVINPLGHEVVLFADHKFHAQGLYSVLFDTKKVTNGIYNFVTEGETFSTKYEIFLRTDSVEHLVQTIPIFKSQGDGSFIINYSTLGIGKKFHPYPDFEDTITDSISFVFFKQGYKTLVKSLKLDTTKTTYVTIVMSKK